MKSIEILDSEMQVRKEIIETIQACENLLASGASPMCDEDVRQLLSEFREKLRNLQ